MSREMFIDMLETLSVYASETFDRMASSLKWLGVFALSGIIIADERIFALFTPMKICWLCIVICLVRGVAVSIYRFLNGDGEPYNGCIFELGASLLFLGAQNIPANRFLYAIVMVFLLQVLFDFCVKLILHEKAKKILSLAEDFMRAEEAKNKTM